MPAVCAQQLACSFFQQPLAAATLFDATIRAGAHTVADQLAGTKGQNSSYPSSSSSGSRGAATDDKAKLAIAIRAAERQSQFAEMVVLALHAASLGAFEAVEAIADHHGGCTASGSSSSSSSVSAQQALTALGAAARDCAEQQLLLQRGLQSMLSTSLKALAATVAMFAENLLSLVLSMMAQCLGVSSGLHPKLQHLAVLARVCCDFGTLLAQPSRLQPAGESMYSSNAGAAGAATEFMVLAAKCLLHISSWLQQQRGEALITASLERPGSQKKEEARANTVRVIELYSWGGMQLQQLLDCHKTTSQLQRLLHGCIYTTGWLLQQLSESGVTGQDEQQPVAAQKAQQQLQDQGTAVTQALQGVAEQLQLLRSSSLDASKAVDDAGAAQKQQWDKEGQQLDKCWQLLHSFASGVIDECPVSSSCCNPHCFNMAMLSEWQLVSGKGCVCNGCGVARYCSRACQVKVWSKHHKRVCLRLRAPASGGGGSVAGAVAV
jgi:hypothetical protein